jgi:hypothetical protein
VPLLKSFQPESHNLWLSACRLFYRSLTNFPVLLHLHIHPSILLYIYPLFVSLFIHQSILFPLVFRCVFLIYSRANVALLFLTLILLVRYRLIAVLLLTGTTKERVADRNHVDIRSLMLQLAYYVPLWLLITIFTYILTVTITLFWNLSCCRRFYLAPFYIRDSSVRAANRAGRSGDWIPVEAKYSELVLTGPGAHTPLFKMGTFFPSLG